MFYKVMDFDNWFFNKYDIFFKVNVKSFLLLKFRKFYRIKQKVFGGVWFIFFLFGNLVRKLLMFFLGIVLQLKYIYIKDEEEVLFINIGNYYIL